ncbi:MAG TPA: class I SAM-dependent methyltransferase, partial [Sandaracinaceae bacterium LLY-WYZ-13_1]|nr:class I SAM-dependent methyltransferase [Sandaracinaceae bacterium LLY-WYZ-13_1]
LELGCDEGAHLLPLAFRAPGVEAVGVETRAAALEVARAGRDRLGLDDVELIGAPLESLDPAALGTFDYVILHGLISWVSPEVRAAALALTRRVLRPRGVAFVSTNAAPGWAIRTPLRDALRRRAAGVDDPAEALRRARELLALLAASPAREMAYGALLAEEAARLIDKPDGYLWHEYLGPHAQPFAASALRAMAAEHGLAVVGELGRASADRRGEEALVDGLTEQLGDALEAEDLADLMLFRAFRMGVWVRDDAPRDRQPAPPLHVAGEIRALERRPSLDPGIGEAFETADGLQIVSGDPTLKAALLEVGKAWPRTVELGVLAARARARLELRRVRPPDDAAEARVRLSADVVELARLGHLFLREAPVEPAAASERPRVAALTRWEAERGGEVSDPYHRPVPLDALTRRLVERMDGYRELAEHVARARALVQSGEVALEGEDGALAEGERDALVPDLVRAAVERLAARGLLV